MSLNNPAVQVARVMDPRLEINRRRHYVALKGAMVNTHQQFPATNISASSCQISCNPPNRGIAIARKVLKEGEFDVVLNGTNTGVNPLLSEGYYALRQFPLTQVTSSESLTLNNATFTQAPLSQYWPEVLNYHNEYKTRFGQYSLTPSMADQSQTYEELAGTVRNPLAAYGDNSYEQTRGSFPGLTVVSNTPTQAVLRVRVIEPILLSPLVAGCKSDMTSALAGIQNMSYGCTFGKLERLLSLIKDQGAPGVKEITSVSVTPTAFKLLFNYLTPDPLNPVPRNMVSSLFSIVSYPTKYNAPVPPGQTVPITLNSIQVSSIPRRMYIFARRDDFDRTAFTADACFGLEEGANPLTITWNNQQFCSQMTTADLYNTSAKNGVNMSYPQYVRDRGSITCLNFGDDIGLASDEAPGVLGNYQLGLTIRVKNTSSETITPTLFVVCVYEGVFTVQDGNCSQQIGVLSREDVLNSRIVRGINYQQAQDVFGGSFWDTLGRAFGTAGRFIKDHKLLSRGLALIPNPYAQGASRAAAAVGLGMSGGSLTNDDIKGRLTYDASELAEDEDEDESKYKYI